MNDFNIISFLANYKKGESGSYPPIPSEPIIYDMFYMEDLSGQDNEVRLMKDEPTAPTISLEFSTDKVTWKNWNDIYNTPIYVPANSRLYLRGNNSRFAENSNINYNNFVVKNNYKLGGDITCLLTPKGKLKELDKKRNKLAFCSLFSNSETLQDAKDLILYSEILSTHAYCSMFSGCTSLKSAPIFRATSLETDCYEYMFSGCTFLIDAPTILPIMELKSQCYYYMFHNCTSLEIAPILPATELVWQCYKDMFRGCSKLRRIEVHAMNWDYGEDVFVSEWLYGVSPTGEFVKSKDMKDIPLNSSGGIPQGWSVQDVEEPIDMHPFYIENTSSKFNIITLKKKDKNSPDASLEFSKNGGKWETWDNIYNTPILLESNDKLFLRGTNNIFNAIISASGEYNVAGDITTLLQNEGKIFDLTGRDFCFKNLFQNSIKLKNAKGLCLPSKILSNNCYQGLFYGCSSLISAPELNAMQLADKCYQNMFYNCTSLLNVPNLPATKMEYYCYSEMFHNCSSITTAPDILPAMELAVGCYDGMFYKCISLQSAPELPATKLFGLCYALMFYGCKSIKMYSYGVKLPATELDNKCYWQMFRYCENLDKIEVGATTWNEEDTKFWVEGVSPTGEFVKPSSTAIPSGVNGIPVDWRVTNK